MDNKEIDLNLKWKNRIIQVGEKINQENQRTNMGLVFYRNFETECNSFYSQTPPKITILIYDEEITDEGIATATVFICNKDGRGSMETEKVKVDEFESWVLKKWLELEGV